MIVNYSHLTALTAIVVVYVCVIICALLPVAASKRTIINANNDKLCAKTMPVSKDGRSYWSYSWCSNKFLLQYHLNHMTRKPEQENRLDVVVTPAVVKKNSENFRSSKQDCRVLSTGKMKHRTAKVHVQCCKVSKGRPLNVKLAKLYIDRVEEAVPCDYMVYVCNEDLCESNTDDDGAQSEPSSLPQQQTPSPSNSNSNSNSISNSNSKIKDKKESSSLSPINYQIADRNMARLIKNLDSKAQEALKDRVKTIYYSAYDDYMKYAYPEGELRPISCTGGHFDLIKIPLVTLIDTLDTFVIMNNYSEFRNSVEKISNYYESFSLDVNVSVFETTIRILGGLLSSHLFAIDPNLGIYPSNEPPYDNSLLRLAIDLGQRLVPAFRTQTGIPYGTVNLRQGVPKGETEVASTAGAGSLVMEFYVLSQLSGDPKYFNVAMKAAKALYSKKSPISLLGKHVHTKMGRWSESVSGIGSNSDSFYEYLWKSYLLTQDKEVFDIFIDTFTAIKRHVQDGDWFGDVDMFTGKSRRNRVENLHAFWPGMESSMGYVESSSRLLNALYSVWNSLGFVPEELDQVLWMRGKPPFNSFFPLRPELIESTYFQYRSTGDRSWLVAGEDFLNSIEQHTKTNCGYAAVGNILTRELDDAMPSFFLAETCKYLYLLFDETNFIHDRPYIFSTEAHPFNTIQLSELDPARNLSRSTSGLHALRGGAEGGVLTPLSRSSSANSGGVRAPEPSKTPPQNRWFTEIEFFNEWVTSFPQYCPARVWWDPSVSYDLKYITADYINFVTATVPPSKDVVESVLLGGNIQDVISSEFRGNSASSNYNKEEEDLDANAVRTTSRLLDIYLDHREVNYHDKHMEDLLSNEMLRADDRFYKLQPREIELLNHYDYNMNAYSIDEASTCPVLPFVHSSDGSDAQNIKDKPSLLTTHQSPFGQNVPVQSIEIPMGGELGTFLIRVFVSGFQVISKSLGNALEVTNIGQHEVFVREYNETSSQSVVGTRSFQTIRCSVDVLDSKLTSHWRRHCSVSTFGAFTPVPLVKTITVPAPDNSHLCKEVKTEPKKKESSWWPFNLGLTSKSIKGGEDSGEGTADKSGIPDDTSSPVSSDKDRDREKLPFEDQIVMGVRGDCMFEDKTLHAQNAGAVGLLVMNTEDSVFIMSGKRVSEDHQNGVPVSQQSRYSNNVAASADSANVRIPVAMLSKADANSMSDTLLSLKFSNNKADEASKAKSAAFEREMGQSGPYIGLNIKSINSQLDTEAMGSYNYPKIIVQQNAIAIRGNDKWGAILTSTTGQDWQLMVVSALALKESEDQLHSVFTRSMQPVCTTPFFVVDPILQYDLYLSSACPITIEERTVSGMTYVVLNEFGYRQKFTPLGDP